MKDLKSEIEKVLNGWFEEDMQDQVSAIAADIMPLIQQHMEAVIPLKFSAAGGELTDYEKGHNACVEEIIRAAKNN